MIIQIKSWYNGIKQSIGRSLFIWSEIRPAVVITWMNEIQALPKVRRKYLTYTYWMNALSNELFSTSHRRYVPILLISEVLDQEMVNNYIFLVIKVMPTASENWSRTHQKMHLSKGGSLIGCLRHLFCVWNVIKGIW